MEQAQCNPLGTTLAWIHNQVQNDEAYTLCQQASNNGDQCWIKG